ncbi:MAG: hypothetical protein HKUEN02_21930 [Anaerolineaceae bacterium]|nr:MAG: hypothetical protein HKUEN02_21930 [Anaerolineaceae bacterium]
MYEILRKELWFNISARHGFANITPQVGEALRESKVKEGLVLVNVRLPTSAVSSTIS